MKFPLITAFIMAHLTAVVSAIAQPIKVAETPAVQFLMSFPGEGNPYGDQLDSQSKNLSQKIERALKSENYEEICSLGESIAASFRSMQSEAAKLYKERLMMGVETCFEIAAKPVRGEHLLLRNSQFGGSVVHSDKGLQIDDVTYRDQGFDFDDSWHGVITRFGTKIVVGHVSHEEVEGKMQLVFTTANMSKQEAIDIVTGIFLTNVWFANSFTRAKLTLMANQLAVKSAAYEICMDRHLLDEKKVNTCVSYIQEACSDKLYQEKLSDEEALTCARKNADQ